MKEERNHLLKVHVTHSGGTWTLKPKANKGGGLEHKQDIIFKGDDEQFRKFLIKLGAKDVETSPASVRNHSYIQMVDDIKTGKDREIWVWTKTWNNYKSNKVVMGMRTTEDKAITVKEAFRIPGTGYIVEEGERVEVISKRVTESDAKAQINILMKGIKDVESAVSDFFNNRENEDFRDSLNQELPKGWEVYHDSRFAKGLPIVMNVKGRGYPDYDRVIEALAKESKMDKDMVERLIDEDFFNDLHQDTISFFMKDVEEETGMPLLVTGRSGGYWGFDLVDYNATRGYDILVLKDSKKFVEKYGADIVSLWLDRGYVFEPRDIYDAIELFLDAISYNSPFRYASGNILEDEATLSPTFQKTLTEFKQVVDSIASELESTDYWVDLIMANDYLEEGVRRNVKPMRRVTESKDPLGVRKLKEGNHEIQFKFWADGIPKPLRSPSLEWLVDMIEIEFLPRTMKELLKQRPQVQVVIDGQILKSGLSLAEIFQAMGKRF